MSRISITVAVFLFTAGVALAQPCPSGDWCENPATGHWYSRTTSTDWVSAEAEAVAAGGHLVTVNDPAENQWLQSFFPSNFFQWIGLYQPTSGPEPGGGWEWVDGDPSVYRNWNSGEPNNSGGNEDHTIMISLQGIWLDISGTNQFVGIIERETNPFVPTVSEWGLLVMTLSLLTLGTIVFQHRVRAAKA
jgi:Lectin C-type domain